jgi:hypothetical protein
VSGEGHGRLFDTVLGIIIHAMSGHSDSVWVARWHET